MSLTAEQIDALMTLGRGNWSAAGFGKWTDGLEGIYRRNLPGFNWERARQAMQNCVDEEKIAPTWSIFLGRYRDITRPHVAETPPPERKRPWGWIGHPDPLKRAAAEAWADYQAGKVPCSAWAKATVAACQHHGIRFDAYLKDAAAGKHDEYGAAGSVGEALGVVPKVTQLKGDCNV